MDFRIIELPSFEAVSSGVDKDVDSSSNGKLGKLDTYFSKIKPNSKDSFMPRDFLYWDKENNGMVWMWALTPDMDDGGFEHIHFEGGYYLTYHYRDQDEKTNGKLYKEALEFIKNSDVFELDERPNHYGMGHIITPALVIKKQGFAIMETFIPVKLNK